MNQYLSPEKSCAVLGCPSSEGQSKCGVKLAPGTLKLMGLGAVIESLGYTYIDAGEISTDLNDKKLTSDTHSGDDLSNVVTSATSTTMDEEVRADTHTQKYAPCGQFNREIHEAVYKLAKEKHFVVNIGGDHGIACGTIAGMLRLYPDLAVIWVDAHGDCNTIDTSPSGHYHGMPAAHLMRWMPTEISGFEWMRDVPPLQESHMCYIGLRSVDPGERRLIKNSQVTSFSIRDVDRYGIANTIKEALRHIDPHQNRPIHLSLDIDSCDPSIAPGTGTKKEGGLTYREIHYICEELFQTRRLVSMDLVEINPLLDSPCVNQHGDREEVMSEATKTVRLGVELIATALGDSIL